MRRRRHINVEETRASILDGAEELFGQRGVHAVSLREINAVCGISQGVLHYHFGGRETLVAAILDRHLPAINETRRRMVDALLEKQQLLQPRDAVSVLVQPLAQLAIDGGDAGMRFVRFLGRLHQDNDEVFLDMIYSYQRDVRMNQLLPRVFGQRDPALVDAQLAMTVDLMFSTLKTLDCPSRAWQRTLRKTPADPWRRVDWLVSFISQGLAEPNQSLPPHIPDDSRTSVPL